MIQIRWIGQIGQIDNDLYQVDGTDRLDVSLSTSDRSETQIMILIRQIRQIDKIDYDIDQMDGKMDQEDHDLDHIDRTDRSDTS